MLDRVTHCGFKKNIQANLKLGFMKKIFEVNILPGEDSILKGLKNRVSAQQGRLFYGFLFPRFPHLLCTCLISSSYWIAGQQPYAHRISS